MLNMNSQASNSRYTLSVIIPCFNAEGSILSTIESIKKQDIGNRIEIIVVDDFSSDESVKCISGLNDIKIVEKKVNQGVSAARNDGFLASSGDYILFLDADDLYLDGLVSSLTPILDSKKYQLVSFGFRKSFINNSKKKNITYPINGESTGVELLKDFLDKKVKPHLCTFCISRNIASHIYFNTKLTHGEDLAYQIEVLMSVNRVYLLKEIFYEYSIHEHSAMGLPFTANRFKGFEFIHGLLDKSKLNFGRGLNKAIDYYVTKSFVSFLYKVLINGTNDLKLIEKLSDNKELLCIDIYKSSFIDKLFLRAMYHFFNIYIFIVKIRSKFNV